jgi:hypothetical protein
MQDDRVLKDFAKWGHTPPSSQSHGTEDEIKNNMSKILPDKWYMEGNMLIGESDSGKICQFIPTDYICSGIDNKGLPVLTKVVLQ